MHSRPGRPQGRGKIERFFATVRSQFLVEIDGQIETLAKLNEVFTAWVEARYHHRIHRETEQTPLERFTAAGIAELPSPALLREAFLWAETRQVTKTAMISLHGNRYEVDPALVGRKVEVIFDPFDLEHVEIRLDSRDFGTAIPHEMRTHMHPKATADASELLDGMPTSPTGIDYLALIEAEHRAATRRTINFADLPTADGGEQTDSHDDVEVGR